MLRSADGGTMFIVLPGEAASERFTVEAVYHSPVETNPKFLRTGGQ